MKNLTAYITVRNVIGYAVFCCLLLGLTVTYIVRADRVYSSSALVLVKANLYNSSGVAASSELSADRAARSQIPLFESEDVIRSAINEIGVAKLFSADDLVGSLKPDDQAYVLARRHLAVELEPLTDLIRVSFRHKDPELSAEFIRVLVDKFSQRYYAIYQNAGTVTFFQDQKDKAQSEFTSASGSLAQYAADHQVYKIEEQQRLLLAQRSKVASSLSATQGLIDQKRAEKDSIPKQLSQMRVVGRLPQVIGMTQQKATPTPPVAPEAAGVPNADDLATGDRIERLATDPPVLLVKVYQDTIANLVKLHTDLEGLTALEKSQVEQLKTLDISLNGLANQSAEFEKLKLAADAAGQRVKAYTKRALDEQLTHAMSTSNLSNIQVVQSPTVPFKPVWPLPVLLLAAAIALCLLPIAAIVAFEVVKAAAVLPQPAVAGTHVPARVEAKRMDDVVAASPVAEPPPAKAATPQIVIEPEPAKAPAAAPVAAPAEPMVAKTEFVAARGAAEALASKVANGFFASKAAAELMATKVAAELAATRMAATPARAESREADTAVVVENEAEPATPVAVTPPAAVPTFSKPAYAPVAAVVAAAPVVRNPVQAALSSAMTARKANG